jgi:diguanylate cyclase (GGDEF)-like protein
MSYVLVADAEGGRTAVCLELIHAIGATVRIGRSVDEAVNILRLHGAPAVAIVDLVLPGGGGTVVTDALPSAAPAHTSIVAWAPDHGVREFGRQHLAGADAHVLTGPVRFRVLETLLQRLLRQAPALGSPDEPAASPAQAAMSELSRNARQLSTAAGVAVYFRAPGEAKFRASVSWTSDTPIPNTPAWMPHVFSSVLDSARPLIVPDLSVDSIPSTVAPALRDGIAAIAAVPVAGARGEVAGMICLFDNKPLALGAAQLDALRALGGSRREQASAPAPVGYSLRQGDHERDARSAHAAHSVSAEQGVHTEEITFARPRVNAEPSTDTGEEPRPDVPGVFELPITLLDRRGGASAIQRELARARREQRQLSIVLFDVDPLPSPSVTLDGAHSRMVVTACRALTRGIRESDLAIRWGQEELLVVLPGLGVGEARMVAERVRAAMQAAATVAAVAGGVAELLPNEPFESVVVRANAKVRLARERGHNRVA